MELLILVTYIVLLWYIINILWLCIGFTKIKSFHYHSGIPKTKFSIIVPFRNEADNLPKLLQSFEKLNYPTALYEVILVDDESVEKYKIQNTKYKITVVDNERKTNSPKKDAINTAIGIANNEWIITTDADCIVNENWLQAYDAFIQHNSVKMIASGVIYSSQNSFLGNFQQLDLMSLQGTTIGSFGNEQAFMCNGANFCYKKSFFKELNGFEGNENIASGDDVFLLQKAILKEASSVQFLKNPSSVVTTLPEQTWKSLFFQRVRWASKSANYKSIYSKQLGLSVFTLNLLLLILVLTTDWKLALYIFALKFLIDYVLFRITADFFKKPLRYLMLSSALYSIFSCTVVFYSFFGNYTWKGRSFKM
ncbi:glycosyltransferase [Flavobacterium sp. H122]|uniref:glycosyltransferase family 2 protein n=1 Tax=Flavobacterium sp. H122 TaxID=2529860 RepID=UPI0010A9CBB3|nr:glycosyltransferase [Flavobacterium sp. H122]